jgi:hypothetical protein
MTENPGTQAPPFWSPGDPVSLAEALRQRLNEVAVSLRRLERLVSLCNRLHDLRYEFDLCVQVVEQAKNPGKLKYNDLNKFWKRVRGSSLSALQNFIKAGQVGVDDDWYRELDGRRNAIETGIREVELTKLIDATNEFGVLVIAAENDVRRKLDKVVQQLLALSEDNDAQPSPTPRV